MEIPPLPPWEMGVRSELLISGHLLRFFFWHSPPPPFLKGGFETEERKGKGPFKIEREMRWAVQNEGIRKEDPLATNAPPSFPLLTYKSATSPLRPPGTNHLPPLFSLKKKRRKWGNRSYIPAPPPPFPIEQRLPL